MTGMINNSNHIYNIRNSNILPSLSYCMTKQFVDKESEEMQPPFWEVACPICGLWYRGRTREEMASRHNYGDHSKAELDKFWGRD